MVRLMDGRIDGEFSAKLASHLLQRIVTLNRHENLHDVRAAAPTGGQSGSLCVEAATEHLREGCALCCCSASVGGRGSQRRDSVD